MTGFYRNWLDLWAWGVLVFGAVLAGFGLPATDGAARLMFDLLGNPIAEDPGQHLRFAVGLMGCVTIGWAVTLMAAFKAAHGLPADQAPAVWKMVLVSALAWYIPDGLLSVATGFPMNVASNTLLLVLLLVPLFKSGVLRGVALT